jgi:hypothetical protein
MECFYGLGMNVNCLDSDVCDMSMPKVNTHRDPQKTKRVLKSSAKNTPINGHSFKFWGFAQYTGHLIPSPGG